MHFNCTSVHYGGRVHQDTTAGGIGSVNKHNMELEL